MTIYTGRVVREFDGTLGAWFLHDETVPEGFARYMFERAERENRRPADRYARALDRVLSDDGTPVFRDATTDKRGREYKRPIRIYRHQWRDRPGANSWRMRQAQSPEQMAAQ